MVRRNPLAAMSGELERNFILRMNHDIAVVVERPREAAGGRHVVSLGLAAVAVALLILQHGFEFLRSFWGVFAWLDLLLAFGFAGLLFTRFWTSRNWRDAVHECRFELLLVGLCAALLVLTPALPDKLLADVFPGLPYRSALDKFLGVVQLFLLGNICIQLLRLLQRIFVAGVRAEVVLAGSFAALVLVGTLLLLLPAVSEDPTIPIGPMDAFFTSVSASCVTGLSVRDTGTAFSNFGQLIILVLIQVGGLGIVTFVAFISVFSAKTLPVPQMVAFRRMISASGTDDLKARLAGIILLTAIIEGAGAVSLYFFATTEGDTMERLKWSVFHSISAFCNAGFALQSNNLESLWNNPGLNFTITVLIILGGLGFLVLPELIALGRAGLRLLPQLLHRRSRRFAPHLPRRLSVQSRISLIITVGLITLGTLGFLWTESGSVLHGLSGRDCFLVSFFQSVTTRTAGFNTVPMGELQQATLILLMALMVIGGSPVSTAGGIKTVTLGILLLALRSLILQREKVDAFGRKLAGRAFFTALNVFVLYVVTASAGMFLISVFDPNQSLRDISFETISALSTVGLSTGITPGLSTGSKLVLCAAMFIGRVGPIALVFSVFESRGHVDYEFPEEDVVVG
jgi:trk system potassium uptake protein